MDIAIVKGTPILIVGADELLPEYLECDTCINCPFSNKGNLQCSWDPDNCLDAFAENILIGI